uniref:SUEL-type lectin domain-containing protein n=1 Tax=Oryzias latipes TaxID=8090 RepID=A0A3P9JE09_ORYLA
MNFHFSHQTKTCCKCVLTVFSWLSLISETENEVISVDSALYGRADRNTCSQGRPFWQLFNTGCSRSGIFNLIMERCDGKKRCNIKAANSVFGDPCKGTHKYLEVTYVCICVSAETVVNCENGRIHKLKCKSKHMISVDSALYGRANRNTCNQNRPSGQLADTSCSQSDTLGFIKDRCNGKRRCNIRANNSVFGDLCEGTHKYLEVAFICICK